MQRRHFQRKKEIEEGLSFIRAELDNLWSQRFSALRSNLHDELLRVKQETCADMGRIRSDVDGLQLRMADMATSSSTSSVDSVIQALGQYGVLSSSDFTSFQECIASKFQQFEDKVSELEHMLLTSVPPLTREGQPVPNSGDDASVQIGDAVCLQGLQNQQYNGMTGRVLAWVPTKGRWQVKLDESSDCKLLAADNLQLRVEPSHKKPRQGPRITASSSTPTSCLKCSRIFTQPSDQLVLACHDGSTMRSSLKLCPSPLDKNWRCFCTSCWDG